MGGAFGFVLRDVEGIGGACDDVLVVVERSTFITEGVKGSLVMSGKEDA